MTIALDANSTASDISTATTQSWSHTIASGNDRVLVVCVRARDFATQANTRPSSVTFGAQSFTEAVYQAGASTLGVSIWYLVAPTVGTDTITVTPAAACSGGLRGSATSFTGVDQSTPIDVSGSATDVSTAISASVTVVTDQAWLIDSIAHTDTDTDVSQDGSQTLRDKPSNVDTLGHSDKSAVSTGSQAMAWTATNSLEWASTVIALRPASSGLVLTAAPGSYTLTGQSSNTLYARIMAGEQGSYTLTGVEALLVKSGSYIFNAENGSYTLVGANALVDLAMSAASGSYSLTGQNATLTFGAFSNPSLTAEFGSYTLTGQNANTNYGRNLPAEVGVYALTGRQAGLIWSGAPAATGYASQKMTISSLRISL